MTFRHTAWLALAALSGPGLVHASCGAAFCMVNTNWELQGIAVQPGLKLDLRYEHVRQNQPRSGSRDVAVGAIRRHHDEVSTTNRNVLATLDYTHDQAWGVSASVPYVDRSHFHIHNHRGAQVPEHWDFSRVGDVRVLGRYQLRSEDAQAATLSFYGINLGLKLPTGDRDLRNAAGARAERTLQPGTGTTDLVLGGYYTRVLGASDASWFVQGLWQTPLGSREDYRPGRRATLDIGYRYEASERIGLMLQLNTLWRGRDRGAQAEPADTGGSFVYVSPGVSYALTKGVQVYAFVQKPVYQYVNGVQLTARWSGVLGIATRF